MPIMYRTGESKSNYRYFKRARKLVSQLVEERHYKVKTQV